jgi:transcriptional regulator with GAF, ATPase, and Fis domain
LKEEQDLESFKTLVEIEKEHIISALKLSNGKVSGEKSAAEILGLNGKTLSSKMRKLGITRGYTITAK